MLQQRIRDSIRWTIGTTALFLGFASMGGAQGGADLFHVGDRVALTIEGPTGFADTLTVREGLTLVLPNMGTISLQGIRRTNVQAYLTQEIARYIKDATVRATALVRIAVLGEVARPGYYSMPSDVLLSDAVMRAGGPTGSGDLNRSTVRRGTSDVMSSSQLTKALSAGRTLDDLQLLSGDQIVVGQRSQSHLDTVLKVSGAVAALAAVALTLSR